MVKNEKFIYTIIFNAENSMNLLDEGNHVKRWTKMIY